MRRSLILAALATVCLASGARAQTAEVPRPYAIPLPPMSEPRWELGARFWASEGKTSFNINSSKIRSNAGQPHLDPHL